MNRQQPENSISKFLIVLILGSATMALVSGTFLQNNEKGPRCTDGIDNDGDGLIDCDDPDCDCAPTPTDVSVRVSKAVPQTIPHTTGGGPDFSTPITFPSERWDPDNMHDNDIDTSRLTVQTPGLYYICGNIEWDHNPNGGRLLGIRLDGATIIAQVSQPPLDDPFMGTAQSVGTLWQFTSGQYVELVVRQTSGVPLDVIYNPIYSMEFGMIRVQ